MATQTSITRWIQQRTGGQVKVATYLQAIEGNAHLSNILYSKRYEDGNRDADRLVNGDGHEHFVWRHVTAHEDNSEEGEEEDELDREKVGGQNQGLQVAGPSDAVHLQAARDGERSVSPFHLRAFTQTPSISCYHIPLRPSRPIIIFHHQYLKGGHGSAKLTQTSFIQLRLSMGLGFGFI